MITTVTQKDMFTIPAEIGRRLGSKPGYRLDWRTVEDKEEILAVSSRIGLSWRAGCLALDGTSRRSVVRWPN